MKTQIKEFVDQLGDNRKNANNWMHDNVEECSVTQVIPIFNTEKRNMMYIIIYLEH